MGNELIKIADAIELGPKNMRDWGLLTLAGCHHYGWHETEINIEKAAAYYKRLVEEHPSPQYTFKAYSRYSEVLQTLGKTREAIMALLELLPQTCATSSDFEWLLRRLSCLLADCDRAFFQSAGLIEPKMSVRAKELLLNADLPDANKAALADFCYRLGKVASYEEEPQLALCLFEQSIDMDDPNTTPWSVFEIGCLWMNTNKDPRKLKASRGKAVAAFKRVIESNGADEVVGAAYWKLAWIEYYGMGLVPANALKALDYCEQAIAHGLVDSGNMLKAEINRYIASKTQQAIEDTAGDIYMSVLQSL